MFLFDSLGTGDVAISRQVPVIWAEDGPLTARVGGAQGLFQLRLYDFLPPPDPEKDEAAKARSEGTKMSGGRDERMGGAA